MDVKALLSTCKMPFFFVLGDILGGLGILVCFFFLAVLGLRCHVQAFSSSGECGATLH